jgi:hypothetical protein
MSISKSVGVLLSARLLDLLVVCAVGGLSAWLALPADGALGYMRLPAAAAGLTCLAVFVALPRLAGRLSALFESLAAKFDSPFARSLERASSVYAGLPEPRLWAIHLSTLLLWTCLFASYYFCAWAVAAVSPSVVTLAGAVGAIAFVLPINGVAQIGPFEAAWTYTANMAGVRFEDALASSVVIHAVVLAVAGLQAMVVGPLGGTRKMERISDSDLTEE